jgi:predicted acetyltransferase
MVEIREPAPGDERTIRDLAVLSFNVPPSWARGEGPPVGTEHMLCAYEGERLLATSRDTPMLQWFGGRPLRTAGVASVATVPEVRSTGLGDELMRALLARARDRGAVVTSLFPATVPFYRRLGYEYGGTWTIMHARLSDLPRDAIPVELFEGDDPHELRACYEAFAAGRTGLVEGEDDDWWRVRVLQRWNRDAATRAVVVRGSEGVEGYACFSLETRGEWKGFDIECTHLVGRTRRALSGLLDYFRRYRGVGRGLVWVGPPNEPLALLLNEESAQVRRHMRYMSRLLDVPGALEARGYPEAVSGEMVLEVDDPMFKDNRGPFQVTAEGGKVRVSRTDNRGLLIPVGTLSSLFAGFISPLDLAMVGDLPGDDPALPFLGALFAGPPPWMMDHF